MNGRKVLFSDKSRFLDFLVQGQHRSYVRSSKGEKVTEWHINQVVKHPHKMFWGSFSFSHLGSLYPCSGIMNTNKYINVANHKVMRYMQIAFPDGGGIFQHDLAPCHSAGKVQIVLQENGIKVLRMAWQFTRLESHRKFRGIIKNKLRLKNCTTVNKLIEAIISVWYHDKIAQFYA